MRFSPLIPGSTLRLYDIKVITFLVIDPLLKMENLQLVHFWDNVNFFLGRYFYSIKLCLRIFTG